MNGYRIVVLAWLALAALVRVHDIDRVRPNITHREAIGSLITYAVLATCVVL